MHTTPRLLTRGRLVQGRSRLVFRTREAIERLWGACGWQSKTACVVGLNGDLRQPEPTYGLGLATQGRPDPPVMAAGRTEPRWK